MSQVLQRSSFKFACYILIAMLIYTLVVALAAVFHLFFPNVQRIAITTTNGVVYLDVVNYLIYGTFDLIFFFIQTVVVVILLFIVWIWNLIVVDMFFHGIGNWLNFEMFKVVQKVPEYNVTLFADSINNLRLYFIGFIGDFFGSVSEGLSDLFGGFV